MMKRFSLLLALALLAGCGSGDNVTRVDVSPEAATQAPRTPQPTFPPPPSATPAGAPATSIPATEVPTAEAPATEAPTAPSVPATEAPTAPSAPAATQAPATQAPAAGGAPIYAVVDPKYGFLLGGSREGSWLEPAVVAPELAGGESYRLYSQTAAVGTTTGGEPIPPVGPCEWAFDIELPNAKKDELIALGGDWNALPRLFEELPVDSRTYQDAVAEILRAEGLADPIVALTRIIRADLDGDGVTEVLISATYSKQGGNLPVIDAGDYSLVALRTVVNGQVQTTLLEKEVYAQSSEFAAPNTYTIRGLADLNGDGKLEVIVDSEYYEGLGISVFEVDGAKAEAVIGEGCGA